MIAQQKQKPVKPDAISLMAAMRPVPIAPSIAVERLPDRSTPTRTQPKSKPGVRAGTRQIAGHFSVDTLKALKHIMAEEDTTLQALLDEAIRDLLVKKGRLKLVGA